MFLCLLSTSPKVHAHSGTLELTQEDSSHFSKLDQGTERFKEAIKLSRKRKKTAWMMNEELDKVD